MELRVGICDDSQTDAAYVETFLSAWAQERDLALHVETFPSAESFLFRYAEEKRFDLLLLDIEMGQLDGVTMAKEIRRDNQDVQIVFITGYSDYIAEGYEVAALHYLLKPVNGDKLRAVLDRAVDKVRRRERALTLEQGGEMVRIPLGEIRYLEVCRNYVTVHAKGRLYHQVHPQPPGGGPGRAVPPPGPLHGGESGGGAPGDQNPGGTLRRQRAAPAPGGL